VGRDRGLREGLDVGGLADIDAVRGDLLLVADLGCDRGEARLVAVGQRKVGAARGKFQRKPPVRCRRPPPSRRPPSP
jgi:hypothetical protein